MTTKTQRRREERERQRDLAKLETIRARAEQRPCGECTECCTFMAVPELQKSAGLRCHHACAAGCAIYPERPEGCADFLCGWRMGLSLESHRPDRVGFAVSAFRRGEGGALSLYVRRPIDLLEDDVTFMIECARKAIHTGEGEPLFVVVCVYPLSERLLGAMAGRVLATALGMPACPASELHEMASRFAQALIYYAESLNRTATRFEALDGDALVAAVSGMRMIDEAQQGRGQGS